MVETRALIPKALLCSPSCPTSLYITPNQYGRGVGSFKCPCHLSAPVLPALGPYRGGRGGREELTQRQRPLALDDPGSRQHSTSH